MVPFFLFLKELFGDIISACSHKVTFFLSDPSLESCLPSYKPVLRSCLKFGAKNPCPVTCLAFEPEKTVSEPVFL